MRIIEILLNAYFWIRVFLSPFFIGIMAGYVAWYNIGGFYGQLAGAVIVGVGAIAGIKFANHMQKESGVAFNTDELPFDESLKKEDNK